MPGRRRRAGVRRLRQRRVGRSASNVPVGGCEFDGRLEVEDLVLSVDGVALGASVRETFLALGGADECHVFDSSVGRTPAVRTPANTDRAGAARDRTQLINARSERS
jgi:hypothetical protein